MKNKGFTLVELLVVIGIIAVLATMAIAGVNYARGKARIVKAQSDSDAINTAIGIMANDTNVWPGHQEINAINSVAGNEICADGCTYKLSDPESGIIANDSTYDGWQGPYMVEISLDPWGHEYFFDTDYSIKKVDNTPCNGEAPIDCQNAAVIGSYGPDGVGSDQYNGDDIIKILTIE